MTSESHEPKMPSSTDQRTAATRWIKKFADAGRGVGYSVKTQSSFWVHVPVGIAAIVLGLILEVTALSMATLVLSVGVVMACEAFNTSIELLVRALHPENDRQIGTALDVAAGAVLMVSVAAVVVGLCILGPPLLAWIH